MLNVLLEIHIGYTKNWGCLCMWDVRDKDYIAFKHIGSQSSSHGRKRCFWPIPTDGTYRSLST